MKRISTLVAALCLFAITQSAVAQAPIANGSAISPSPTPTPGFGLSLNVNTANGFTSSNQDDLGVFPKGQADELTSPSYYYTSDQSTIYFKYNFTVANSKSTTTNAVITILYGLQSFSATLTNVTIAKGTNDFYFSITPTSPLPANTNFQIKLSLGVIDMNDNAIKANSLTTNANLVTGNISSPLPVKFSSFDAKAVNAGVALTWKVGTEQNVNGYEVERSADGRNFTSIGFVKANGQSAYTYTDSKPLASGYYRIKSVDIDAKLGYSTVVSLKGGASSIVLKAFPSPVQNELTIQHNTATSNNKITISSVDGRLIQSIIPVAGSQQTKVDLSSANAGLYLVRFYNGSEASETLKVIKQ